MAADVVGYSRLMGANEVATLKALQQHQAELVGPEISRHGGRIVKLTGDGALVEFSSVVSAVECATAIQRAMPDRNSDVPEDRRIEYRVGINLDDVIVEGDDLFGDGVNIAARLEGIARPAASPFRSRSMTSWAIGWTSPSRTAASNSLRISPGRSGSLTSFWGQPNHRPQPKLRTWCRKNHRSRSFPSPT
jgi:hypothetical protein